MSEGEACKAQRTPGGPIAICDCVEAMKLVARRLAERWGLQSRKPGPRRLAGTMRGTEQRILELIRSFEVT